MFRCSRVHATGEVAGLALEEWRGAKEAQGASAEVEYEGNPVLIHYRARRKFHRLLAGGATELDLHGQDLTAEDGLDLAQALAENCTLTQLSLHESRCPDKALAKVVEALGALPESLCVVSELSLRGTGLGARTCKALAKATSLSSLDVSANPELGAHVCKFIETLLNPAAERALWSPRKVKLEALRVKAQDQKMAARNKLADAEDRAREKALERRAAHHHGDEEEDSTGAGAGAGAEAGAASGAGGGDGAAVDSVGGSLSHHSRLGLLSPSSHRAHRSMTERPERGLTILNLSDCGCNAAVALALGRKMLNAQALTELDLSDNEALGDEAVAALLLALSVEEDEACEQLRTLRLANTGAGERVGRSLRKFQHSRALLAHTEHGACAVDTGRNPKLNNMGTRGLLIAKELYSNSTMTKLNLTRYKPSLGDEDVAAVIHALSTQATVRELNISDMATLGESTAEALVECCSQNTTLQRINLSGNHSLGDEAIAATVRALCAPSSNVRRLLIGRTSYGAATQHALAAWRSANPAAEAEYSEVALLGSHARLDRREHEAIVGAQSVMDRSLSVGGRARNYMQVPGQTGPELSP